MKKIMFFLFLVFSVVALASGGESHHDDGAIPFSKIGWQAANLGILLVGIFIVVRKSIISMFSERQKEFIEKSEKTKSAMLNAEKALTDIKSRLEDLEKGEKTSLERAQNEASILLSNTIKEAEAQVIKAKTDAQLTIQTEAQKAKAEISNLIFDSAIKTATQDISNQSQKISDHSEASFLKQLSQVKT